MRTAPGLNERMDWPTPVNPLAVNLRAREARAAWQNARGALHQALALRGSRVAVYDLRETIEQSRGPLPTSFVAALHVVGDASCLEPIAGRRRPQP